MRDAVAGAGRHRIEFNYQPASWRIGWIISLLSLLGWRGPSCWRGGAAGDRAPPDAGRGADLARSGGGHGGPRTAARSGAVERGYLVVLGAAGR